MSTPQELNSHLQHIHKLLEDNPGWKDQLDFTVHRRNTKAPASNRAKNYTDWRQVWRLTTPDVHTMRVLVSSERHLWVQQPHIFVSPHQTHQRVTPEFSHPTVWLAWEGMLLQQRDARAVILRRCLLVAFWDVARDFKVPAAAIALQLAPYLPFLPNHCQNRPAEELLRMLVLEVENMLDAGSRYKQMDVDAGPGIIVVLGTCLGHNLFDVLGNHLLNR